ncbi:MAG: F0F1 ATP synthase subunit A [Coriobacteriia bacterium]|nr:F0F1 ATP synthase subunit A [Coriobacteriia bacterium]
MEAYNPLTELPAKVDHLLHALNPLSIFGTYDSPKVMPTDMTISANLVGYIITSIIFILIMFAWMKRYSVVPHGRFVNALDFIWEFVRVNIVENIIQHNPRRYLPFVSTIFLFVLISNLVSLIPGAKPATGVISGTLSMSFTVYLYFNYVGIKDKGGLGYLKSIVPAGVPGFVAPIIMAIEIVSMALRPITQALRLFASVYAGHIILGIFAILTEIFAMGILRGAYVWGLTTPLWFLLLVVLYVLEIMIAFIQAYVFSLLTAVYIDNATSSH